MARWSRWRAGWDDVLPLAILTAPMLLWAFAAGGRGFGDGVLVVGSIAVGFLLKHLLPTKVEDLALLLPAFALLVELATLPLAEYSVFLAAWAGVGLLLWAGVEPTSGVSQKQQLEPALVPTLAGGVALVVMLFLPGGSGGQVGLATLALVGVLGLSAWIYLRSAAEVADTRPTG